jgi:hypothetical protein
MLQDYESIEIIIRNLGNLQDKLNSFIKITNKIKELNEKLKSQSLELSENIHTTNQSIEKTKLKININSLLSKDPELSYLVDK